MYDSTGEKSFLLIILNVFWSTPGHVGKETLGTVTGMGKITWNEVLRWIQHAFPVLVWRRKLVCLFFSSKKQEDKLERFAFNVNSSTHLQLTEKIIKINDASA